MKSGTEHLILDSALKPEVRHTVAVSAHAQKQIRQTNSRSEVVVHMPKLHVQK